MAATVLALGSLRERRATGMMLPPTDSPPTISLVFGLLNLPLPQWLICGPYPPISPALEPLLQQLRLDVNSSVAHPLTDDSSWSREFLTLVLDTVFSIRAVASQDIPDSHSTSLLSMNFFELVVHRLCPSMTIVSVIPEVI